MEETKTRPKAFGSAGIDKTRELLFDIGELDCADCAAHFEEAVRKLSGVKEATLNFSTAVLKVSLMGPETPAQEVYAKIVELGEQMGHTVTWREGKVEPSSSAESPKWLRFAKEHRRDLLTVLSGLFALGGFLARLAGAGEWIGNSLYGLGMLAGGYYVARAGWYAFRATRSLDMNALMTIAALGAMILGEWAEGALVIFLFSLGNTLESYTVNRARNAIRALMSLAPKMAVKLEGEYRREVAVEDLAIGDRILVRPDERVPMDGVVESGHSAVNQAPVTGESIPVEKGPGDEVYAGTINGEGALAVRVTRLAQDNTISRIIRMVEEAQARKAPSQRFVDRFARVYTPLVIAGAVLVAILPPLFRLGTFGEWFYRALVLLVISCPCALVISTPVSIVSAIASAARMGVLVKGGAYLEELGAIKVVAFDKTGTLTKGEPTVVGGYCSLDHNEVQAQECVECRQLLAQAAAVERGSTHPLARAVVSRAERLGLGEAESAEEVRAQAGRGVRGKVNGHEVAVGSHAYVHDAEQNLPAGDFCRVIDEAADSGRTTVVVADLCCQRRGLITVADEVRPTAPQAIADLKRVGVAETVMLTGDNQAVAQIVAERVGVDKVRAGLSPADKVEAVRELLARHGKVAMVGDGVNDAPALAQATVGIAMGVMGTDAALETADVALMADDLGKLVSAIKLSRRTLAVIRQNIALSLLIKAAFLALAVAGVATLWMAVFADVGTSMLVIANGMRLLKARG